MQRKYCLKNPSNIYKPAIIIFEPVIYEKEKRATNSPVIVTTKTHQVAKAENNQHEQPLLFAENEGNALEISAELHDTLNSERIMLHLQKTYHAITQTDFECFPDDKQLVMNKYNKIAV